MQSFEEFPFKTQDKLHIQTFETYRLTRQKQYVSSKGGGEA